MADVEHISRKGTAVAISWFPVPEESELPERLRAWFAHYRQLHEPTESDPILADRITLDHRRAAILDYAVNCDGVSPYALGTHGQRLLDRYIA